MMVNLGANVTQWSGGIAPVPVRATPGGRSSSLVKMLPTKRYVPAVTRRYTPRRPAATTTLSPAARAAQLRARSMRTTHSTPSRSQTVTINLPPQRATPVVSPTVTEDTITRIAERIYDIQRTAAPVTTTKTSDGSDKKNYTPWIIGAGLLVAGAVYMRRRG